MPTVTYPIYELHLTVTQEYTDGTSAVVMDGDCLTVQQPYEQEKAREFERGTRVRRVVSRAIPLHGANPVAAVAIESPHSGHVIYGGSGHDQDGQVVDFGGPNGPGGIHRIDARGLINDALVGRPGFGLVSGDRESLSRYLFTRTEGR